jgi:hypothetical protein
MDGENYSGKLRAEETVDHPLLQGEGRGEDGFMIRFFSAVCCWGPCSVNCFCGRIKLSVCLEGDGIVKKAVKTTPMIVPTIVPMIPIIAAQRVALICLTSDLLFHSCNAIINCGLSVGYWACHAARSGSFIFDKLLQSKLLNSFCSTSFASFSFIPSLNFSIALAKSSDMQTPLDPRCILTEVMKTPNGSQSKSSNLL